MTVQVERLGKLLGVAGDSAYTCETAAHFWLLHVLSRWEAFLAKTKADAGDDSVLKHFPFKVRRPWLLWCNSNGRASETLTIGP